MIKKICSILFMSMLMMASKELACSAANSAKVKKSAAGKTSPAKAASASAAALPNGSGSAAAPVLVNPAAAQNFPKLDYLISRNPNGTASVAPLTENPQEIAEVDAKKQIIFKAFCEQWIAQGKPQGRLVMFYKNGKIEAADNFLIHNGVVLASGRYKN